MSATGNAPVDPQALKLPPYSMDVETLDLGAEVKAVGLELLETESREPVKGKEAAAIWAAAFPALANNDGFSLDSPRLKKARETPCFELHQHWFHCCPFLHLTLVSEMTIANDYIRFSSYCS